MRQGLYTKNSVNVQSLGIAFAQKNSVNVQSLGITFAQKTHLLINILL